MFAADAREHSRDVAVFALKREAALRIPPGKPRQAAFDRCDAEGRGFLVLAMADRTDICVVDDAAWERAVSLETVRIPVALCRRKRRPQTTRGEYFRMGLLKRNISPYDGILFRSAVQSQSTKTAR